jgi:hypothetical protein
MRGTLTYSCRRPRTFKQKNGGYSSSDVIAVTDQESLYLKLCFVIPTPLTSELLCDLAGSNAFH